jgi:hypothetical protein
MAEVIQFFQPLLAQYIYCASSNQRLAVVVTVRGSQREVS